MKRTTKKEPAIATHFMLAFEGNLKRASTDSVNETVCDIEDVPSQLDDDYRVRASELPKHIPEAVRKEIVAKSQEVFRLQREIGNMMSQLSRTASKVLDAKEREDERSLPHCKTCGQVVPSKKRR